MSKHTPTPGEAFEATLYTWVDWKGRYRDEEEARAAWERMIAEVERAASEKALTDAAHAFAGGAINVEIFSDPAERDAWRRSNETRDALVESLRKRATGYRREEA